ncbi:hypothetical protein [Deinococcus budaensis]|uniref:SH3 domain-containing protein n=1 Tax=Deinococcus budaensis TaxID=1665626 RepID=A0A7W8LQC9_9DEIO|nr:hypothetical protein [Deinococcus budaensis]MBB5234487.1 hypothetical protein [Deinococcus budaensis]
MANLALLLGALLLAAPPTVSPPAPVCRAQVTARPSTFPWLGRIVVVTPRADCPKSGVLKFRFRSPTGTQPDAPPGFFTLKRGQKLTRRVPARWWVEELDRGRWQRVPERRP